MEARLGGATTEVVRAGDSRRTSSSNEEEERNVNKNKRRETEKQEQTDGKDRSEQ